MDNLNKVIHFSLLIVKEMVIIKIVFGLIMVPMLVLHYKRPFWAYILSVPITVFLLWWFHVPVFKENNLWKLISRLLFAGGNRLLFSYNNKITLFFTANHEQELARLSKLMKDSIEGWNKMYTVAARAGISTGHYYPGQVKTW